METAEIVPRNFPAYSADLVSLLARYLDRDKGWRLRFGILRSAWKREICGYCASSVFLFFTFVGRSSVGFIAPAL